VLATAMAAQQPGAPAVHQSGALPANVTNAVVSRRGTARSRAWQVLLAGVNDKKALGRVSALTALGDLGGGGVRLAAIRLREDKDADVRTCAALALAQMKSRAAISSLRAALHDPDAGVSFAAAQALWQLGDRSGRQVLLEVLTGQRAASDSFLHSSMRDVQHKLQNPRALVYMGAEKGAGALMGPFSFGIPVAKQFLADPANAQRALTANLLSRAPDRDTLEALKNALWDKDWAVRQASARAVGSMKRRDFIPLLIPLLNDDKPPVRYAAAVAILKIMPGVPTAPSPASPPPTVSAEVH
jgi:HEAT repeat protein